MDGFSFGSIVNSDSFKSNYIPLISFKSQLERDRANDYILREVNDFFNFIKLNINLEESCFSYSISITSQDFLSKENTKIEYFYHKIFHDLGERDQEGKLIINTKWCPTFDIECAPIKIPQLPIAPHPSCRRFGTIDIRGKPVLYYIYFTLQEILDHIKNSD
jgi:hypothetical protein